MDVRELYGGSELQRHDPLREEVARLSHSAFMAGVLFAMPVQVTEDSPDGHNATIMPTVMRAILDPVTGARTFENHPIAPDTPPHFPGGAGAVLTHGLGAGDEGVALYLSRSIDGWRQLGGTAQPFDNVINDRGDAVLIPGIRSDPRKLQQVDTAAMHMRSEDKLAVHELRPGTGVRSFHADPSTPPASATFDPLAQATTYLHHLVQAAVGVRGQAVSPSGTHEHGVTHDDGAFMRALGTLNEVLAHPTLGALLSAQNGQHTVTASPSGVMIQSAASIALDAPSLSLPSGGVGSSALAPGAASTNVGSLSGDLAGTLPDPQVVGILHVTGANALPVAANDAAAAALTPPVQVGQLYRNGSVLMVRVA